MPQDEELDRDSFYGSAEPEADDDDYELEPPDDEIIAGEKRRAAEAIEQASMAVDVDELYREDTSITLDDLENQWQEFKLRFSTKHLLIAMTVVAVLIVVGQLLLGGWFAMIFLTGFALLASTYGWVLWKENVRRQEWEAKRDELYRRNQERRHT